MFRAEDEELIFRKGGWADGQLYAVWRLAKLGFSVDTMRACQFGPSRSQD